MMRVPYTLEIPERPSLSYAATVPRRPLWDFQEEIVADAVKAGSGLIQSPTGSGKTTMMLHVLSHLNKRSLCIVPTRDLVDQVAQEFYANLGVYPSIVDPSELVLQPNIEPSRSEQWVLSTWQGLWSAIKRASTGKGYDANQKDRLRTWFNSFGAVWMDEAHYAGAKKVYEVLSWCPAAHRYGTSATPWRLSGDDLRMMGSFGEISRGITPSELIKRGKLVKPYIKFERAPRPEFDLTNPKEFQAVYRECIVDNLDRNLMLAERAIDYVNDGHVTLAMVTQIRHGEIVKQLLEDAIPGVVFVNGQMAAKKRKAAVTAFRAGELPCVISSSVFNVGVDFPVVSAGVLFAPYRSSVINNQRIGRFLRIYEGKEKALITETRDWGPFVTNWSQEREVLYRQEEAFDVR